MIPLEKRAFKLPMKFFMIFFSLFISLIFFELYAINLSQNVLGDQIHIYLHIASHKMYFLGESLESKQFGLIAHGLCLICHRLIDKQL